MPAERTTLGVGKSGSPTPREITPCIVFAMSKNFLIPEGFISLTVEEIGRVDVNLKKSPFRVEFFGKDGGKLLRINDSGFVFGKGYFGRSLAHFRIRRRIIVNRMPPLAAVERTLTEQFSAYERSWVSFKYRDVTYLIGYDGGSFFAFAEGESERTEVKEFSDLLSFECKDGVTLDAAWEYTSDFTLIT